MIPAHLKKDRKTRQIRAFSKMLGGQKGEQNCARSRTDRDHVDQVRVAINIIGETPVEA